MSITGGAKTRAVLKRYPVTSGLTAETTKTEGRTINLVYKSGSTFPDRKKKGMY